MPRNIHARSVYELYPIAGTTILRKLSCRRYQLGAAAHWEYASLLCLTVGFGAAVDRRSRYSLHICC